MSPNEMLQLLPQSIRDQICAEITFAGIFSVSAATMPDTANQDKDYCCCEICYCCCNGRIVDKILYQFILQIDESFDRKLTNFFQNCSTSLLFVCDWSIPVNTF